uniref:hypothetical protein n=1 Tax=Pedobacter schmidteae TaxID=2201271 RepID=UPI000EB1C8C7|nr:hypothetical protein [Pedobacter schmidteae]
MKQTLSLVDQVVLDKILSFIRQIGITVVETELPETTFLPGLNLGPNCIYVDYGKLRYPGDILHEAGHLAVTDADQRSKIGTPEIDADWPNGGEEMGAMLWSYAALKYIGIPEEVVFHPNGYKGEAEWLINNFKNGTYIGMPFLEWTGIALGKDRAQKEGQPEFPTVLKWLRD